MPGIHFTICFKVAFFESLTLFKCFARRYLFTIFIAYVWVLNKDDDNKKYKYSVRFISFRLAMILVLL